MTAAIALAKSSRAVEADFAGACSSWFCWLINRSWSKSED
jgi:hypothetical protein